MTGVVAETPQPAYAADQAPNGCNYAQNGAGKYKNTICWIDFSNYNEAQATSGNGQQFSLQLGGGYSATFTLTVRPVDGYPYHPTAAFSNSDLAGTGFAQYYGGMPGRQVLWNRADGGSDSSGVVYRLGNISVRAPDGSAVSDYRFVSSDAESTFEGETVTFNSNTNLQMLEVMTPNGATGGCFADNTTVNGTTSTCQGRAPAAPSPLASNVLLGSTSPSYIEQTIRSDSRNAGAFGFMMSRVQFKKVVEDRILPDDTFNLTTSAGGVEVASASTGTGNSADTGISTVLASNSVRFAETGSATTDMSLYNTSWSCQTNGANNPQITPPNGAFEANIPPSANNPGDFTVCTLTNDAKPRSLKIQKTSDAAQSARVGQTVKYQVQLTNTGTANYTAASPASFSDDLSKVLDDATYNDDATASFSDGTTGSAPVLTGATLNWSGPLKVGETATFTYSVTLTNAGDGSVVNNACVPQEQAGENARCSTVETKLPRLTIEKTSDTQAIHTNGGTVTYQVTVTNQGPGDATEDNPAKMSDDLSDVLDDGSFIDSSLSATSGTPIRDGNTLTWSGPLTAGKAATITYQVAYDGTRKKANHELKNVACLPVDLARDPKDPCKQVDIPAASLQEWKTVDPSSGSTIKAGQVANYTLHFRNSGKADATVKSDDVLTEVLDDADVTVQPTSSSDALKVSEITDGRFTVTGTLVPGAEETVTYSVKVKPDGQRGDDTLNNFLVPPGGKVPPGEVCIPKDDELPNCTTNPIPVLVISKSSDPTSGTQVQPGQDVTYTLTIENQSKSPATKPMPVDYTDHMADVLDDANLTDGPTPSNANLQATTEGDTIHITGGVPAQQTYTVTYTVKVKAYDQQGNHRLGNVVSVTGEIPECVPGSHLCTQHPLVPAKLAITGGPALTAALWSMLALLLAGGAAVWASRRRTHSVSAPIEAEDTTQQ